MQSKWDVAIIFMIVRLVLIVAASVAAYGVQKFYARISKTSMSESEHEARSKTHQNQGTEENQDACSTNGLNKKDRGEEEEEEEVELISSIINRANNFNDEILPEVKNLPSVETEFPLPTDRADNMEKDTVYETEMASNASELERLRGLVREMEERELKLEGELLEYYGLKKQESDIMELQRQLKIKTVEIDMLKITINSLHAERKKLQEELAQGDSIKRELEEATSKIKELQRRIQLQANQTKGRLLLLKQQVSGLQAKEEEAVRKDAEIEKKLKVLKELEEEVVELRRKNIELQHEKRELTVKLDAAQSRIAELSNVTENEMVAKAKEEVNSLKHSNEDLLKQVEGLQMNRFSEVEELVYLRWVNTCLRHELRNYEAPPGKISARDLNRSLSPKSQKKAKQLMLEYAGLEHGEGDTDLDSNFSNPSSPGIEDFENVSIYSSTSRYNNLSKKASLLQKLKTWGKSKDDSSVLSSPVRSLSGGSPSRMSRSMSHRFRGPLEALMLRNAGDSVSISTFGQRELETTGSPETAALSTIGNISSNESLNFAAASFQLMSKSVDGSLGEKYPAYKDRHKLALAREKQVKEKAEQGRLQKFSDISNLNLSNAERDGPVPLPPKLTQLKEKAFVSGSPNDQSSQVKNVDNQSISKMKLAEIEKRPPRVPRAPPKPSGGVPVVTIPNTSNGVPPVPAPPPGAPPPAPPGRPPPSGTRARGAVGCDKVHRAPELVEFYQTLMKREAKKDTSSLISSKSNISDARRNMIGEIANKSSFLLAVKADVETQGDFVMALATEVRAASFSSVEDLVAFVNWLDEELSFLVDERAVLKHFDWPECKADALREAAFEYQNLMKLEKQVSSFTDDPKLQCEAALMKMYSSLEKVEQSVHALLRTRDMAISRYREFGIPVNWLMDSGVVGKIKLSSVQLAKKYMKRIASELDMLPGPEMEPMREFFILQGLRFAFRVHQFAEGFDAESMKAFEELRSRIHAQSGVDNKTEA